MFLEAIQVHGGRGSKMVTAQQGARDDRALNRLLTYSTDLDPQFAGAYKFAGNAMPRQDARRQGDQRLAGGSPALQGDARAQRQLQIPFALGFLQSYFLARYEDAGRNFAAASRLPGAPAYVGLLADSHLDRGRRPGIGGGPGLAMLVKQVVAAVRLCGTPPKLAHDQRRDRPAGPSARRVARRAASMPGGALHAQTAGAAMRGDSSCLATARRPR